MSAQLRIVDTDGSTVITSLSLSNIESPGSSSEKKVYVENFGDQTAQSVVLSIVAVGTNDGADYAATAPDVSGSPGVFGTSDIALGDIASLARVAVWTQTTLPSGLTADNNPRRFDLSADGVSI